MDQIAKQFRPLLEKRRVTNIADLTAKLQENFPKWFGECGTAPREQFVRRLCWTLERIGKPASDFLSKNVRQVEGKGFFTDHVITSATTLLPPVEVKNADSWRCLNDNSQLLLYHRIFHAQRALSKKEMESYRHVCIAYDKLQPDIKEVSSECRKKYE